MTTIDTKLAVDCRGIVKTYGKGDAKVTALRGVDLRVPAGELLMLVGPSGCGKTTLISIVAGILDRDAGDCRVFGQDYMALSAGQRTKWRGETIGFVFQAFNLLPTLTAAENVAVPLLIRGTPRGKAVAKAKERLDQVGLGRRTHSMPRELSGGQQQRVAIARALVHDPKLIVADEPTGNLDPETAARVLALFASAVREGGAAAVIVTHSPATAAVADRVLTLTGSGLRAGAAHG